ncbi:MAG: polymer-forming cytoskeletal protein [Lachnospiraceae bacterium]|nr:polymer-forming cytoskeletal protein [Lachnospiraceae bacterium]
MGFFGDLKQDLSQAVNELMPDENAEAVSTGTEESNAETQISDGISLEELLENIDEISIPEEAQDQADAGGEDPDLEALLREAMASGAEEEPAETEPVSGKAVAQPAAEPVAEPEEKHSVAADKGEKKTMEVHSGRTVSDETSIITAGMTITGDIVSEGSVDVIGNVNGNIDVLGKLNITGHVNGNSKAAEIYAESAKINGEITSEGAVKIGASTVIIGNITAASAAIAGAVKGDIDVKGPVILDASAIVMGNIKSKSVQINNGAVIEGMCSQCYADVSPTAFFDDYKPDNKKKTVK